MSYYGRGGEAASGYGYDDDGSDGRTRHYDNSRMPYRYNGASRVSGGGRRERYRSRSPEREGAGRNYYGSSGDHYDQQNYYNSNNSYHRNNNNNNRYPQQHQNDSQQQNPQPMNNKQDDWPKQQATIKLSRGSFAEHVETFRKLSSFEKLQANGYRSNKKYGSQLDNNFPEEERVLHEHQQTVKGIDWVERKKEAASHAVKKANEKIKQEYNNNQPMSDEEEDSDESDAYMATTPRTKLSDSGSNFLEALQYCLLFDVGFRVVGVNANDQKTCWCPCGKYMQPWRDAFGLDRGEEITSAIELCGNDGGKVKKPMGLMGHLDTQGKSCVLHYGISCYLNFLYKEFYHTSNGVFSHEALFDMGDMDYSKSIAAREKEKMQQIEERDHKIQKLETQNKEFQDKLENLRKVNEELADKMTRIENEKEKLGITKEESKERSEMTEADLKSYQLFLDCLIDVKKVEKSGKNVIQIKPPFRLQDFFDNWYKKVDRNLVSDKFFLFRDLNFKNDNHYHAHKLLGDWEVQYDDAYVTNNRNAKHVKEDRAIDEGGPTREFLNEVFKQMQALKVKEGGIEISLFEEIVDGKQVVPTTDDIINMNIKKGSSMELQEILNEKIKRYYRALGRLMLMSRITGNHIHDAAFPNFYRNIILRECDLQDQRYTRNAVFNDLTKGMGMSEAIEPSKVIGQKLIDYCDEDIEEEENELITKETYISKFIYRTFVKSRSIFIDSLREGLTLDGYIRLTNSCRIMPEEAISKIMFARNKLHVEEVIKILQPVYNYEYKCLVEIQQQFFKEIFKPVIQDKAEKDPEFLSKFVCHCTSFDYIPHPETYPDFSIKICFETMDSDSYPQAHTCEKELDIPATCYALSRETFLQKFDFALETAQNAYTIA